MNTTLLKGLIGLVPTLILLCGSILSYARTKTMPSLIQLVGAGCFVIVALTHVCEGLNLFPSMRWGAEESVGHYVDLWSAVLGLLLFPLGYFIDALAKRPSRSGA